ncbi:MAG: beta-hydroxyacyl-ACP dehydratase [Phycisphaerae bacterium]|nr:beta-hydroxyacyl-ACP dehydratase [Phycisphaerae bacterium]
MRFILLDRVEELEPGKKIVAIKNITLAEEYLQDHFPAFPVLPGVLSIEALVQSAAMLVRVTNDFRQSMIVLDEAVNVKYKNLVKPGNTLRMELIAKKIDENSSSFVAKTTSNDIIMVEARLKLRHFNLADKDKDLADVDVRLINELKQQAKLVGAC